MTLQTKIAMVTGAGLGSGEATAKTLAKTATTLVVADINGGNAKKVAQAITSYQHRAVLLTADAGSVEEIQRRVVAARSKVFEVV
jgi:glucose 1-dehydrogenase